MIHGEDVQFWQLGYRLFHGNFLRFMSGIRKVGHAGPSFSSFEIKNKILPCQVKTVFTKEIVNQILSFLESMKPVAVA
jgi:hypothetical protein